MHAYIHTYMYTYIYIFRTTQVLHRFIQNMSAGPPDENAVQRISFSVQVSGEPGLFVGVPVVDSTGTLLFETAVGKHGIAMLNIVAVDDGGRARGGFDSSEVRIQYV